MIEETQRAIMIVKGNVMSENAAVFMMDLDPEDADPFMEGLKSLIDSTKHLGPVAHICLLAEAVGYIVVSQFPDQRDAMAETIVMNMDRGIAVWLQRAMERAAEGKPN